MNAIILASGIGKRLKPLTNDKPKSLVRITKKTILEHQLDNLAKCGIKKVIITTGPFEDKIRNHLAEKYDDFKISYVHNPKYDSTNYIYSLWLTKTLIDDDIILLHGDLLFDEKLLKKIIDGNGNLVLVDKKAKPPEKDFKAVIEHNKVIKIGVDFFGKNTFFCLPLYKFSKKDFLIWIREMDKEIKDGNLNIYAEDAFNKISNEIILRPLYCDEKNCMEIDTIEELNLAKEKMKNFYKR